MASGYFVIYTDAEGDEFPGMRMSEKDANADIARILKAGFVEHRNDATKSRYFSHPKSGETVDYIVNR